MNQTKKSYQTPSLTVHGDASQLTQATKAGGFIDRRIGTELGPLDGAILKNS